MKVAVPILLVLLAANAASAMDYCGSGRRITCVVDGDTFWLNREKIRLADIDAPEMDARCDAEAELSVKAKARLRDLLSSGAIGLEREGLDRYSRTLAIVTVEGRSVGEVLLAEGLAQPWEGRKAAWCPAAEEKPFRK